MKAGHKTHYVGTCERGVHPSQSVPDKKRSERKLTNALPYASLRASLQVLYKIAYTSFCRLSSMWSAGRRMILFRYEILKQTAINSKQELKGLVIIWIGVHLDAEFTMKHIFFNAFHGFRRVVHKKYLRQVAMKILWTNSQSSSKSHSPMTSGISLGIYVPISRDYYSKISLMERVAINTKRKDKGCALWVLDTCPIFVQRSSSNWHMARSINFQLSTFIMSNILHQEATSLTWPFSFFLSFFVSR